MTPQEQSIPYGYCHCGCGCLTTISKKTRTSEGIRKGEPTKYIIGHARILPRNELGTFKIDGVYCRLIPLTKGQYTLVYQSDYEWLSVYKWQAHWNRHTRSYYAVRCSRGADGKFHSLFMHREILGLSYGDDREGDHAFCDTLDNRRFIDGKINLRIANNSEQKRNQRRYHRNQSGYKGVTSDLRLKKWRAQITVNHKRIHLGLFSTATEAYAAYCAAAFLYHGEFARLK